MQQDLRARFNGLQSVEMADDLMRKTNALSLAFSALHPSFRDHNMCEKWGICLLHNHWLLDEGELPIQDVEILADRRRFTTAPRTNKFSTSYWPSVLSVAKHDYTQLAPLEYSTDVSAATGARLLESDRNFVSAVISKLNEVNLVDTFGLISLKFSNKLDLDLLERTLPGRITVVDEVRLQDCADMKMIQTAWRFMPEQASIECEGSCFQRCAIPEGSDTHVDEGHTPAHRPG